MTKPPAYSTATLPCPACGATLQWASRQDAENERVWIVCDRCKKQISIIRNTTAESPNFSKT